MRAASLVLVVTVVLGALAASQAHAVVARSTAHSVELANNGMYIVTFTEAPLASYAGGAIDIQTGRALTATTPRAIGTRKLNLRSVESRQYLGYLRDRRNQHLSDIAARVGRPLTPAFVYEAALNGVALQLTPAEADRLRGMPGVASVHPDFKRRAFTDAGPQWIHADKVWSGVSPLPGTTGSGVVIGVIDTGINRTHPAFSGTGISNPRGHFYGLCVTTSSWCTSKLIGIYDFTTGSDDAEANDGLDHVGHGTHTSSTAAGAPVTYSVSLGNGNFQSRTTQGVAKGSNLIMYKACEEQATCEGTWLIAAIDQAVSDGVDVINYSIGGSLEDPWDPGADDAAAMLNARAGGAVVVVAAGNEGPNAGTLDSPGNAPWVLTAAAATHNRIFGNQLDLAGGSTAPPNGGVLIGAGLTGGIGPLSLVHANPVLCAEGANTTGTSGENKPAAWNTGTYPNKMVVCDRGIYPRVAKSQNVQLAGGGGMVLVNQASDGESVVADAHVIPSTHLGYTEGQSLLSWMSSGTGQTGKLEGTKITLLDSQGDLLASFSSRGPVDSPAGVLKPDVTAPGVDILAADGSSNSYAIMSGTSMATPHTAGAAALMMAAHPTWGSNEVISALVTTARPSDRIDSATLATPFEQGAGTLVLDKAIKAGLSFDVTQAQFTAANPAASGVPHNLNLPSLVHESCFETCSLSRTARNISGASATWNISVVVPTGAIVTPNVTTMTLANNATQALNFAINVSDPSLAGHWVYGTVTLHPTTTGLPDQVLPIAIFASPTQAGAKPESAFNVLSESGSRDANSNVASIDLSGLVALPNARYAGTPLVPIAVSSANVARDSDTDPFDVLNAGVTYTTFTLPEAPDHSARTYKVVVDATASASISDIDLYVGQDLDGNGLPSSDETSCTSAGPTAVEHCEFEAVNPGGGGGAITYWALAQNFSGPTGTLRIETSAVPIIADNNTLVATGPGHLAHLVTPGTASVRLIWNDPTFLTGQERRGYVIVSTAPGTQTTLLPVKLTRTGTLEAAYALANNQPYTLSLAGGTAQDRLYFDVPGNATSVTFSTTNGSGLVDLYAAHVPYSTTGDPVIPAAPARSAAQAKATTSSPNETITLTGGALLSGRWYVTPVNTGSTVATATVTAKINSGNAPIVFNGTAFYDPLRSGSGIYLNTDRNGYRDMDWYTYLEDQTPVWYGGSFNPIVDNSGQLYADVLRITDDGTAGSHNATKVGSAVISMIDDADLVFSYNVNGESGSAPMTRLGLHNCPTLNGNLSSTTGIWYPPSRDGIGDSIIINFRDEYYGIYLYDGQGNPRWASAEQPFDGNASRTLPAVQLKGACPQCSQFATSETSIGSVTRNLVQNGISSVGVNVTFASPIVPQAWSVTAPVSRLSVQYACPAQ